MPLNALTASIRLAKGCAALRSPDGRWPEPVFYPHSMAEYRMRGALETFAKLLSLERAQLDYAPFSSSGEPFELSEQASAFFPAYRERLRQGAHSVWAQGLDELSLGLFLWEVGEYGIRVNSSRGPGGGEYPAPRFDGSPTITRPMRVALRLIANIENGERMTGAEVNRRITAEEA